MAWAEEDAYTCRPDRTLHPTLTHRVRSERHGRGPVPHRRGKSAQQAALHFTLCLGETVGTLRQKGWEEEMKWMDS